MKRIPILMLLLLAVLPACSLQREPTVLPEETFMADTVPTTIPAGICYPGSEPETSSGDALQSFPLATSDHTGFLFMGSDLLLFSGTERTTLTKYSSGNFSVSAAIQLNCILSPHGPAVQVCESGITYYDTQAHELVFLDALLEEKQRIKLPDTVDSKIAITADCRRLYYCTDRALRCMDPESGLDRLVKEMNFSGQYVSALHCSDTVVSCTVTTDGGSVRQLYLNAENGQLLAETAGDTEVFTLGNVYFASCRDRICQELLTGDSEFGPALLTPDTLKAAVFPALESGNVVLASEGSDSIRLDCYELRSGKRIASLTLEHSAPILDLRASAVPEALWFLRYDPRQDCQVLCRWDPEMSAISDSTRRLSVRYSPDKPDYNGIAVCREIADTLCQRYGVQILLWTDATAFQPQGHTLTPEYQAPLLQEELRQLETILSLYPEGFLKEAAKSTSCGFIQICLVRSIHDSGFEDCCSDTIGLQYWDDRANAYISIPSQPDLSKQSICHQLFHIIESRVMTVCKAYDSWDNLNPKGFSYSYDDMLTHEQQDSKWLEGKNRAFIDRDSMRYPREDRARIMECAMMPGNEALFESTLMQKKLRQLCLGIREAFGLKSTAKTLLWEQYLHKPLK